MIRLTENDIRTMFSEKARIFANPNGFNVPINGITVCFPNEMPETIKGLPYFDLELSPFIPRFLPGYTKTSQTGNSMFVITYNVSKATHVLDQNRMTIMHAEEKARSLCMGRDAWSHDQWLDFQRENFGWMIDANTIASQISEQFEAAGLPKYAQRVREAFQHGGRGIWNLDDFMEKAQADPDWKKEYIAWRKKEYSAEKIPKFIIESVINNDIRTEMNCDYDSIVEKLLRTEQETLLALAAPDDKVIIQEAEGGGGRFYR